VKEKDSLLSFVQQQGITAARGPEPSPLSCPWPIEMREEVIAWFAGYSLGAMVRRDPQATAEIVQFD